ncbi:MAG: hypothetical protein JRC92_11435 [Deltaproteobacteria bacterium]|nr:hypothetical protein [Deltaproteobacteria bacterium]
MNEENKDKVAEVEETLTEKDLAGLPEAVRQAKANGKKILKISDEFGRGETFYFVMPTRTQMDLFIETTAFKKKPLAAMMRITKTCALDPSGADLMARFETEPALALELYERINTALGGNRNFDLEVF